jgi:NhaP-type Na+/H+ or K+/H+ antiporter
VGSLYYVGAALGAGILPEDEASVVLWTAIVCVLVSVVVHGVTANAGLRTLEPTETHEEVKASA